MEKWCSRLGNSSYRRKGEKNVVTSCDLQSVQVLYGRYFVTGSVQRLRWTLTARTPSDPLLNCTNVSEIVGNRSWRKHTHTHARSCYNCSGGSSSRPILQCSLWVLCTFRNGFVNHQCAWTIIKEFKWAFTRGLFVDSAPHAQIDTVQLLMSAMVGHAQKLSQTGV